MCPSVSWHWIRPVYHVKFLWLALHVFLHPKTISCIIHLISVSMFIAGLFKTGQKAGNKNEGNAQEKNKSFRTKVPVFKWNILWRGRREGDNESRALFPRQPHCFNCSDRRTEGEKSRLCFLQPVLKKRTNLAFAGNVLEQLCTNPVIMRIFWKHVKAVWKWDWAV